METEAVSEAHITRRSAAARSAGTPLSKVSYGVSVVRHLFALSSS